MYTLYVKTIYTLYGSNNFDPMVGFMVLGWAGSRTTSMFIYVYASTRKTLGLIYVPYVRKDFRYEVLNGVYF